MTREGSGGDGVGGGGEAEFSICCMVKVVGSCMEAPKIYNWGGGGVSKMMKLEEVLLKGSVVPGVSTVHFELVVV